MEKIGFSEEKPLFETADYAVELFELPTSAVPHPKMAKKYAIYHKAHQVIAGLSDQFGGAIEGCRQLQEALERTINGDMIAGERPLRRPPPGFSGGPPPQLS